MEDRTLLSASTAGLDGFGALQIDPDSFDSTSILVRFRSEAGCDRGACDGLKANEIHPGAEIQGGFALVPGLRKIGLSGAGNVGAALEAFRNHPLVLYAEPDYRVHTAVTANDPRFSKQWSLDNNGQTGGTADADIDAPEAWDLTTGSGSTIVAVIDTGVDYSHPDLAANMWVNTAELNGKRNRDDDGNGFVDDVYGYDFANGDGDPMDDNNHGTHVAGTIGAVGNNGVGVSGVSWNTRIMALKFLDGDGFGFESDAIAALDYAIANGATISNNSWGGDPFSQPLYDAISAARDAGHIFVAAAGNGDIFGIGQDNDAVGFYPASYDLDNIVTVAATDHADGRAFFSNYGVTSVDLGAPGVSILSTMPKRSYGTLSGTSMAAPHVSGAVSLIRDLYPAWTYEQVIAQILGAVDPVDSMAQITVTGGRLNLAAALVPDTTGPRVIESEPVGTLLDPVGSLRVTFNESIDVATFTTADIISFTGPAGAISVTGVESVSGSGGRQFDITFNVQTEPGSYSMTFGPAILDRIGNAMDQDDDGNTGETPDDQFTAEFTLVETVGRFDFGTSISPVAAHYTQLVNSTAYAASLGHGWQGGWVGGLDRFSGTDLTRDFNYTVESTFLVDVPVGRYDVIVTLGDAFSAHDQMGVFLEGLQVDSVDTGGGQFVTNTYSMTVSDGQLNLRLKDLGGSDPYVMIDVLDIAVAGPDTEGPRVNEASPSGAATGPLDRITLTFSEPILDGSFTAADVASLTGPAGAIAVLEVNKLSANQYEVVFAPQNEAGSYSLTIGPDITDTSGNAMDQDGDGTLGEAIEDRFTTSLTLEPGPVLVGRFDFGTSDSPVADGYTQLVNTTAYDATLGHGWQGGWVGSLDRFSGTDLTRDFNYTVESTFLVDVPAGRYDVIVTLGDAFSAHDQMGVFLEGLQVDSVDTGAGQFVTNTYSMSVSDGQLSLRLKDLGGSDPYVMIDVLDIAVAGPDTEGPRVSEASPSGAATGPVDRISLTFSEPILDGSFTAADVVSLTGPAGAIAVLEVNRLSANQYEVVFAPQNEAGSYGLTIGPDITDTSGNPMDQDGDGTLGETIEDRFTTSLTLEPGPVLVGRFDFGTSISPVADGYTQLVNTTAYDANLGHGWQGGWVGSLDRFSGSDLTRDFNYTVESTFLVDVPAGRYDVIVTFGDAFSAHDQMGVFLEGLQVDSVDTGAGQFVTNTYSMSVSDGQLSLRLKDLGGSDPYVMIDAVEIAVAGPDTEGPRVSEASPSGAATGPLDRISLTFSEPILDGTFTAADVVSLTGPAGAIAVTEVNKLSANQYEVVFAPQNVAGSYGLTIGPDITDTSGNPMDQDGDGTLGETIEDRFTTSLTLEPGPVLVGRFDFGTSISPVADGYTQLVNTAAYDSSVGYGWQGGWVGSLDRFSGSDLTRDFNYTAASTFLVDVVVTFGDAFSAHDKMGVFLEGVQVDLVRTRRNEFVTNTYAVSVNDGQLTLQLQDLGGSDPYVMIDAMEIAVAGPATASISGLIAEDFNTAADDQVASRSVAGTTRIESRREEPQQTGVFLEGDTAVRTNGRDVVGPSRDSQRRQARDAAFAELEDDLLEHVMSGKLSLADGGV